MAPKFEGKNGVGKMAPKLKGINGDGKMEPKLRCYGDGVRKMAPKLRCYGDEVKMAPKLRYYGKGVRKLAPKLRCYGDEGKMAPKLRCENREIKMAPKPRYENREMKMAPKLRCGDGGDGVRKMAGTFKHRETGSGSKPGRCGNGVIKMAPKLRCGDGVRKMAGTFKHRGTGNWSNIGRYLLLLVVSLATCDALLLVKCPQVLPKDSNVTSYCTCFMRSSKLTIKCDFKGLEGIEVTRELMAPFLNVSLTSTYVRMLNTTATYVRSSFMQAWHQAPSAALDIWHCANLTLESAPPSPTPSPDKTTTTFDAPKTFAGMGIVKCKVNTVPPTLLRDRTRGGFRIKDSIVNTISKGFLHRIEQMRYLVLDKSEVGIIEGSVASEGFVTLSRKHVHTWYGLKLLNTTINNIGPGAFNLTHQSDTEAMEILGCQFGNVGTGGLVAAGDIEVTIKDNMFERLATQALKVDVTGTVTFDHNEIRSWEGDALEGFMCHNRTSIERNTILVDTPLDVVLNQSVTPFHTSCGNPQIFLIITPEHELDLTVNTTGAWVLGIVLLLVVLVAALLATRSLRGHTLIYRDGMESRLPVLLKGREFKTSLQNLPNNVHLNHDEEEAEAAMQMVVKEEPQEGYEKQSMVTLTDDY